MGGGSTKSGDLGGLMSVAGVEAVERPWPSAVLEEEDIFNQTVGGGGEPEMTCSLLKTMLNNSFQIRQVLDPENVGSMTVSPNFKGCHS